MRRAGDQSGGRDDGDVRRDDGDRRRQGNRKHADDTGDERRGLGRGAADAAFRGRRPRVRAPGPMQRTLSGRMRSGRAAVFDIGRADRGVMRLRRDRRAARRERRREQQRQLQQHHPQGARRKTGPQHRHDGQPLLCPIYDARKTVTGSVNVGTASGSQIHRIIPVFWRRACPARVDGSRTAGFVLRSRGNSRGACFSWTAPTSRRSSVATSARRQTFLPRPSTRPSVLAQHGRRVEARRA